jgi:hypothetical protein
MHIPSQLLGKHFPVEFPSMQPEVIASYACGSHETLGFGIFVFHIYDFLYIRREASWDLDTEKDFKEDFLLFLGKSVAGRPLKLPWMHAVSFFMTFMVLPCIRCIF